MEVKYFVPVSLAQILPLVVLVLRDGRSTLPTSQEFKKIIWVQKLLDAIG